MMKHILLFVLLCFFGTKLTAQGGMRPFEDYTKCYMGFISAKGDTIYPAQFELAYRVDKSLQWMETRVWIAKLNGHYGLLSETGAILIPFEYDGLTKGYAFNDYIFQKGEKFGVVSTEGAILMDAKFDNIELVSGYRFFYYKTTINNKVGLYSLMHKELVPTKYTDFAFWDDEVNYYRKLKQNYIVVYDSLTMGVLDSLGNELLKPIYRDIDFRVLTANCDSLENFFLAQDQTEQWGLYNQHGKEIIAPSTAEILLYDVFMDSCRFVNQLALRKMEKGSDVRNLKTGAKSAVYKQLSVFESYGIYGRVEENGYKRSRKAAYGMLDADLKELPIHSNYPIAIFTQNGETEFALQGDETQHYASDFRLDAQVVPIYTRKNDERFKHEKQQRQVLLYGFYNYISNKVIEPDFHYVSRVEENGKAYFWAYHFSDMLFKKGDLTIYDDALNVLATFKLADVNALINLQLHTCRELTGQLLFFKNQEGYLGGINLRGDVLVPFDFSQVEPGNKLGKTVDCYLFNWILTKNGNKGLYSMSGEELLAPEYDELIADPFGYYLVKKADQWTLLNNSLAPQITNCTELMRIGASSIPNVWKERKDYTRSDNDQLFLAVKDGYLFIEQREGFMKVDSTYINFTSSLIPIAQHFIIRKDGKVMGVGDNLTRTKYQLFVFKSNQELVIFDMNGNEVNRIPNIKYFNAGSKWLDIQGDNGQWGCVDLKTGETILKPNYAQVTPFYVNGRLSDELFWVARDYVRNIEYTNWNLVNRKGELVFHEYVDFTFNIQGAELSKFRHKGLYGLIDSSFNVIALAKYSHAVERSGFYLLKKSGKWEAYSKKTGFVDLKAESMVLNRFPKGWLVFDQQSVGVVDVNLNWILPLTDKKLAIEQMNFVELLGLKSGIEGNLSSNRFIIKDTSSIVRQINNAHILELADAQSTKWHVAEDNIYLLKSQYGGFYRISEIKNLELTVNYFKHGYLSVTRKENIVTWDAYIRSNYSENSLGTKTTVHTNYRVHDYNNVEIELKDLFAKDDNFVPRLDQLLTEIINKKQLFGPVCVNLGKVLDEYKRNFYLKDNGIVFCQPNNTYQDIFLTNQQIGSVLP